MTLTSLAYVDRSHGRLVGFILPWRGENLLDSLLFDLVVIKALQDGLGDTIAEPKAGDN